MPDQHHRVRLKYGARFSGTTDRGADFIAWLSDEDFRRHLKLAFLESKDIDKALDVVRMKVVKEVSRRG